MNSKMSLYLYVLVITLMVLVAGFATGGKHGKAVVSRSGITIEELYKNWENYDVYYQGASSSTPFGIMFDPKYPPSQPSHQGGGRQNPVGR